MDPTLADQEAPGTAQAAVDKAKRRERVVRALLFAAASVAMVVTGAIIWTLVDGTRRFFSSPVASVSGFLGNPQWASIGAFLVGALGAVVVADALLSVVANLLRRSQGQAGTGFGDYLATGLVRRWLLIAVTPVSFLLAEESLGTLLGGGTTGGTVAPALATLVALWVLVRFAGDDVLPGKRVLGADTRSAVVLVGLAGSLFGFLVGWAAPVLGYAPLGTSTFLGSVQWAGIAHQFSIWPLLTGTLLVAGGALLIAGPIGIGAALYLAEFADDRVRAVGKPLVEVLAGVPSIVYGFFALFTISPWMQETFGAMTYNAGSAIVVVAVMVLPIVVSLSDDAISNVPDEMRDASLAMGATEWETSVQIVLPAARSGVFASVFLGLARALGETMAVVLAAGSIARFHFNPLTEVQTMTTYIARVATGDIPPGPAVDAAFAVGLVLFLITYAVNWGGQEILERVGVPES